MIKYGRKIIRQLIVILFLTTMICLIWIKESQKDADYFAWKSVQQNPTLFTYLSFISKFPDSEYSLDAKKEIRNMEDNFNKIIKQAKEDNMKEIYRRYLWAFPNGKYANQAADSLSSMSTNLYIEKQSDLYIPMVRISVKVDNNLNTPKTTIPKDIKQDHPFDELDYYNSLSEYWISNSEITIRQYEIFLRNNGRRIDENYYQNENYKSLSAYHPVGHVSWNDAMEFCQWLSSVTGRHYHLPTDFQWEYACAADSKSIYYFGNDDLELQHHAWYYDNVKNVLNPMSMLACYPVFSPQPTCLLQPNPWGLYDMYGNVAEWCMDSGTLSYSFNNIDANKDGYETPSIILDETIVREETTLNCKGKQRIIHGGSFTSDKTVCTTKARESRDPIYRDRSLGFRVCMNEF